MDAEPGRSRRYKLWAMRGAVALGIVALSSDLSPAGAHSLEITHTPVQSTLPAQQDVWIEFTLTDDCAEQDTVAAENGVTVNTECDPPQAEVSYWTSTTWSSRPATISGGDGSWSGYAVIPWTEVLPGSKISYQIYATQRMNGAQAGPTMRWLYLLCTQIPVPSVSAGDHHDVRSSHGAHSFTVESIEAAPTPKPKGPKK